MKKTLSLERYESQRQKDQSAQKSNQFFMFSSIKSLLFVAASRSTLYFGEWDVERKPTTQTNILKTFFILITDYR